MKNYEYHLLTNGNMAASIISPSQHVEFGIYSMVQAVFTGSPVGDLTLQVSNDNVTYSTYTGSLASISAAGDFAWIISDMGYAWIRLVYARTSGTGTLNVTINVKGA